MKFGVIFILVFSFFLIGKSFSQKPPQKFGDVTMEEMKMSVYEKDSSANAVVLYDFGVCEVKWSDNEGSWKIELTHSKRIKIFNKNGYDYGNFSTMIYTPGSKNESISSIKGITYHLENDKIVETKLDKETIFKKKMDADWTEIKVALPNIKEGCIVEFSYTISSDYVTFLRSWSFQEGIPVVWSEYWVKYPEYFDYAQFAQGHVPFYISSNEFDKVTVSKSGYSGRYTKTGAYNYNRANFRWVAKDVPAFKEDKFLPCIYDHISKIDFQLNSFTLPNDNPQIFYKGWEGLCKDLIDSESFGGFIFSRGGLRDKVEELIFNKTTSSEKITSIYQYITENVNWNKERSIFTSQSPKEILFTSKNGNSAEINLLLVNMLNEAKIEAYPVVLSTRSHGKVNKFYPEIRKLNHVIACVVIDNQYSLIDATDPMRPINMLDYQDLNGSALIVKAKGHFEWIEIATNDKARIVKFCALNLDESGVIEGDIQFSANGYHGLLLRKMLNEDKDNTPFKVYLDTEKLSLTDEKTENVESLTESLKSSGKLKTSDFVINTGDRIFLDPFLEVVSKSNPFKKAERTYPVDFGYPQQEAVTLSYTLPNNYTVEELPTPIQFSLPENTGSFKYNATLNGKQLQFNVTLNINKSVFQPEEYAALKRFYEEVSKKLQEQVVLKKSI